MKKFIASILISSSLIFACSNSTITQNQVNTVPILVSEKEADASEIEVNLGEEFVIVLDRNATTGYQWAVENYDNKFITFIESKYEPSGDATGAGGKSVWTFKANNQGKTIISMKYSRPWEKDVEPIKKQKFNVNIKESSANPVLQLNFFTDIKKKMGF